jgi:hypothetical protein
MTTEFNDLLSAFASERMQIWLVGTRDQVIYGMNELYVKQVAPDRALFIPLIPLIRLPGKFATKLER